MTYDISIHKLADCPEVAEDCAAWLFHEWGHRREGATLETAVERFLARADRDRLPIALVAITGGKAVGTISIVAREEATDDVGPWIASLFVPPGERGSGIAKRLLKAVEDEARRLGFHQVWLSAAVPEMYRRAGYAFTDMVKHGEPVMRKTLG